MDLTGRVAMITGAWRGLGRNAAARLHERGASVAVNVREENRANEVASTLGPRALAVPGDITDPRVPTEIVSRTRRQALETNMTAPFLLIKAALPAMKAQSYGRIINISSSAGRTVS